MSATSVQNATAITSEIVTRFTVNVTELQSKCIKSSDFQSSSLFWSIKICRSADFVNATLISYVDKDAPKWSCEAQAMLKLLTRNGQADGIITENISKHKFDHIHLTKGIDKFVDWDTFLKDDYVNDDEVIIEFKISTDPPVRRSETEHTSTKMNVIVENVNNLTKYYSPKLIVRGIEWNISFEKIDDALGIYLNAERNDFSRDESWEVNVSFKILPWSGRAEAKHGQYTKRYHRSSTGGIQRSGYSQFLNWIKFIDPQNKYVQNDTAQFLVEFSVGSPKLGETQE